MNAKLVSVAGAWFWRMPEGTFLRARNDSVPWAILIKTPEGVKPLCR